MRLRSSRGATHTLRELRQQIDRAVAEGRQLDWIDEHVIGPASQGAASKAALWLHAFAQADRETQAQVARESLALVGG